MMRALSRVAIAIAFIAISVWIVTTRRETGHIVERERSSLFDALHLTAASFSDDDRAVLPKEEAFIHRLVGVYEGDVASHDLTLTLPAVYLRGSADALQTSQAIDRAASTSVKDAFLFCLFDPPRGRSETSVLAKVRTAYASPVALEERTRDVHRLADAYRGLRVLDPSWEARARAARDLRELSTLRTELERVPINQARTALRARLLIVVADEPGEANAVVELDGERPHDVRVEIVDVVSSKVLLRQRRHVDPSGWSSASRSEYAMGLDSCALAYDLTP